MSGLSVSGVAKAYRVELPREDALSSLVRFFSGRSPSRPFLALDGISFELAPGKALALRGHNGSGKTTLLKILAGITAPTSGFVSFSGKRACLLGFASILQDRLSVKENARLCAIFFELPGDPAENAERIMAAAGLEHLRNARAGELSSGMRLRLPFMAALSSGADLFLLDETLAVGDADFRRECLARLAGLKRSGAMLVFATHDDALAMALADEALLLEAGRPLYLGPAHGMPGAAQPAEGALARALARFAILFARLRSEGFELREAPPASDEDLLLVHTPVWLARLKANDLSPDEERLLLLPSSRTLLPRAWRMAGGTLAAARRALASGLGVYPPGGGHHAFPDRGAGFSAVNDIAIAARRLLKDGLVRRPAVIDLDAHQGNGTAFIFPLGEVATFSAHRAGGYPINRHRSTLDVELPPGAGDADYLAAVEKGLGDFLAASAPDFVFALCSGDPYEKDPLGGLKLSRNGLRGRDELLFRLLKEVPVCLLLGASYSPPEEAAEIDLAAVKAAFSARPSAERVIDV